MQPISFPEFSFNSPLAKVVIELERLRGDLGAGTTDQIVFSQLKSVFQLMTSIMSARIEGNRTSIVDAVEGAARAQVNPHANPSDGVQEILLLQKAAAFIDEVVSPGTPITHSLVRELHRIAVFGLVREGDRTPGAYRTTEVSIGGSRHVPPLPGFVQADMSELLDFINAEAEQSYDLLKVAIAHHRFVWIHPFGNGNGRVGRLLTYAVMVSQGFSTTTNYRALNPTAVFGADRTNYYRMLERADSLETGAIVDWCTYLLEGLRDDLEKLKQLGDRKFVTERLLLPAITKATRSGAIDVQQSEVLGLLARQTEIKSQDIQHIFVGSAARRSQGIRKMLDQRLIEPIADGKRSYRLVMVPGPLTSFVIRQLDDLGFLPSILRDDFA